MTLCPVNRREKNGIHKLAATVDNRCGVDFLDGNKRQSKRDDRSNDKRYAERKRKKPDRGARNKQIASGNRISVEIEIESKNPFVDSHKALVQSERTN